MTAPERSEILELVRKYHQEAAVERPFEPGVTKILPSGAVFDEEDRVALVEAALDMRIAAGPSSKTFEREFARFIGLRKAHLTNSGSSANLLAISSLTAPRLGEKRLKPGDEVITAAAGFPTTVNPIVQNGLVPVFVDVELGTYNTTAERVADAIGPRTRAIILAHTLGNPFQAAEIARLAADHGLYLIEDNCDAVGSTYQGRMTGTFGHMATVSFYPAHHITTGEGGCILTNNLQMALVIESFRDWGRDCWCEPGNSDTCHKRFEYQLGALPAGYDHKYTFSHVGYNLKSTDIQAALGVSQLRHLPEFIRKRKENWQRLREQIGEQPWLLLPEATAGADPSWFGFIMTIRPEAPFERAELISFLEGRNIGTRLLFAGNLTRQPAYQDVHYRVADSGLANSDVITERTFWVGVYPGLTTQMIDYIAESVHDFLAAKGLR